MPCTAVIRLFGASSAGDRIAKAPAGLALDIRTRDRGKQRLAGLGGWPYCRLLEVADRSVGLRP